MIVTRLFIFSPAARPRSWRDRTPAKVHCNWCATGRSLASAHTPDQQRNPMLSGSSEVEIGGSYPKFSRVPAPGAVSFVLATSRFGMTARGATELTILPSLRFQASSDSRDSTGEALERGDGTSDLSRRIFPESRVPPCRRLAFRAFGAPASGTARCGLLNSRNAPRPKQRIETANLRSSTIINGHAKISEDQ